MRKLGILAASILASGVAWAQEHGLDGETVAAIEARLAEMECQMDPDDIEVETNGYELDDVICKGGKQFDIELDTELNEVGRREE